MGFGDIVPVSGLARPLSVLEGVFGQLYLAIMIARLVGLHITRSATDYAGAGGAVEAECASPLVAAGGAPSSSFSALKKIA